MQTETKPEPSANPTNGNGSEWELVPWTRDDGKAYLTLQRNTRRGHKRLAIPVEDVERVAALFATVATKV